MPTSFIVYSTDNTKVGTYHLKLQAQFAGIVTSPTWFSSNTFTLAIYHECTTASLTVPDVSDYTYIIGDDALTITLDAFTESVGSCGSFSYSMEIADTITDDNGVISFSSSTRTLTVYTSSVSYRGWYDIEIVGSIDTYGLSISTNFKVYCDVPKLRNTHARFVQ